MSYAASRISSALIRDKLEGLQIRGLVQEYMVGRRSWRTDLKAAPLECTRSWDRAGVEALMTGAIQEFEGQTGVKLPYNLRTDGPWCQWPGHGKIRETDDPESWWECPMGTTEKIVGEAARYAGWIRAVSKDPIVVELIRRCTSPNGVGFPATTLQLGELHKQYSPGKLSRQLRAIRTRANAILSPYGLRVSWRALGTVLEKGPRRVGKAAICAAALTLGFTEGKRVEYSKTREYLVGRSRSALTKIDTTDGVRAIVDWRKSQVIHGVTVTPIVILDAEKPQIRPRAYLVRGFGRSYHVTAWTLPCYRCRMRCAAVEAVHAWTAQRKLERAARLRDARLKCVSVLVQRDDSRRAGNCNVGTYEFTEKLSWSRRWYVPAEWLYATGAVKAENAALAAEHAVLQQMA